MRRIKSSTIGGGGSRRWRCADCGDRDFRQQELGASHFIRSGASEHQTGEAVRTSFHLLGLRGDDQLVSFHLKRLLNGATGVRIMLD